ncbi:tetratricopeptide repeat protein 19, mitochondrial [Plakobranchus ocellatus]|uniref:Tetratricopeptide repeat protein 19, mitochondrial n=1 Tax=Plakobranchus ocellatus TaxID=259542 RepID=A0AAV3XZY5_9GAST|nr:tetratricopeptide repeat protein 19, mitochondrial [Plakobranchus ocellatus]
MATSTARRLTLPLKRAAGTIFFKWNWVERVRFKRIANSLQGGAYKPRKLVMAGSGLGVSYALFGFSFGKKEEESEKDILTETYRDARLAHARKDLKKADDLYHEALKIADEQVAAKKITYDKFITSRTLMYDGLADIAMQTGQIETAERLYKETMKGCLQQGMEQDANAMVELALKLASIYAIQGRKEEAEEGYKFCLQATQPKMADREKQWRAGKGGSLVQKKKINVRGQEEVPDVSEQEEAEKNTAALLGMTLGSYGRFLLYEKRYKEALPLFEKARLYAENTLGTESNQYIVVLNDLATLYIVTKNLAEAEKLLKDGIKISDSAKLGEGASLYCNLGAVYLRKGQTMEAMSACKTGLELAQMFDHKTAYKMAEACLHKGVSILSGTSHTQQKS